MQDVAIATLILWISLTILGLVLSWLFIFSAVRAGVISAQHRLDDEQKPRVYRG